MNQDAAGLGFVEASCAKIEQCILSQLPNGRAVCALDIICEDFQFWFRINLRILGEEQRLICLLGISFLGINANDNLAVKN